MRPKTQDKCQIWWCGKPHYANGYCKAHDTAVHRYGTPYGKHAPQFALINDIINHTRELAHLVENSTYVLDGDNAHAMFSVAHEILKIVGEE